MIRLIDSDEMKIKGYMRLSGYTVTNRLIDAVVDSVPTVQAIPIEDILGHAKAIKEYCQQRDNIDDCCEGCPFHDYLGTKGICVLNYGLYPNEWYKPNNEGSDTE